VRWLPVTDLTLCQAAAMRMAAVLVTVLLWSSSFVGIRAEHSLSAGSLAAGRLVVGSVVLGALVLVRREAFPARAALPRIAACGVLWFGLYNLALNEAEHQLDAGVAALLVYLAPLVIVLLAGLLLKEGFPRFLLAGCAIAFAGTVLIGLATARYRTGDGWGVALALVAALGYAGGVVVQKPLLRDTSALQVTWLACVAGTIVCLPFLPGLVSQLPRLPGPAIGWLVYLGVGPTAIAFTTWAFALSRTSLGAMAAITYLVPPLTVLLGWIVLRELPPPLALAGGAVCLAGAALATVVRPARAPGLPIDPMRTREESP